MATRTTPTVAASVEAYLARRANQVSVSTLVNDRSQLRKLVVTHGHLQVGSLQPHHLEDLFYGSGSPYADQQPASFNKALRRVIQFVTWCHQRGFTRDADLLGGVCRKPVHKKEHPRLTPEELAIFPLLATHPRDRALFAVAVNSGLRAGSLVDLRVSDLRLGPTPGDASLTARIGKGHGYSEVSVTADMELALRQWLQVYNLACSPSPTDYLFPAMTPGHLFYHEPDDTRIYQKGDLNPGSPVHRPAALVQRALVRLGWSDTKGQGFHTIRRSVGRFYFDKSAASGSDSALRLTSALLHHKSTTTTEIYLGMNSERATVHRSLQGMSFLPSATLPSVAPLTACAAPQREVREARVRVLHLVQPPEPIEQSG